MSRLATALRDTAQRLLDERDNHESADLARLLSEASELARVAARFVEGKDVHGAFGAPGDWGYDTEIGQALYAFYKQPRAA